MAKIYLAAMYSRIHDMQRVRDLLVAKGHRVTSQWIDGREADDTMASAAIMNLKDLLEADTLVAFSLPRGMMHNGGGRHVEFGLAIAFEKKVIVVGPRGEHVFHALPGILFFSTFDELLLYNGL